MPSTPLTSDVLQGCFHAGAGGPVDASLLSIEQMAASQRVYPCSASALLSRAGSSSEGGMASGMALTSAAEGARLGRASPTAAAALLSGRSEDVAGMTAMSVRSKEGSQEGSPEGNARSAGRGNARNSVYMTDLADLDTGSGKLGAKPAARLDSG